MRTLPKAAGLATAAADRNPVAPFEQPGPARARGQIDELVFARLARLGIELANPCSDAVFLRRACLDVIGTLPTEEEASQFLADRDPNRRGALIERLLARDEFADYWALKWEGGRPDVSLRWFVARECGFAAADPTWSTECRALGVGGAGRGGEESGGWPVSACLALDGKE